MERSGSLGDGEYTQLAYEMPKYYHEKFSTKIGGEENV